MAAPATLSRGPSLGNSGGSGGGAAHGANGGANGAAAAAAASSASAAATASLFVTPPELICPITQDLLLDPVLTQSGQVSGQGGHYWSESLPVRADRRPPWALHPIMHAQQLTSQNTCICTCCASPNPITTTHYRPLPTTQIYERAAIETHLARAAAAGAPLTDPLSNAPLASDQLLPVFPVRSRAAEYREATVRAAAAAAAREPRRDEAARLLRRAAELAMPPAPPPPSGAAGHHQQDQSQQLLVAAPGLSPDLCRFLASHRGDAYSAVALKFFANSLAAQGFPDRAADVFYGLLLDADRQQQAEYLRLCLACWGHKGHGGGGGGKGGGDGAGGGDGGGGVDGAVIAKLADFVERQRCLGAGAAVDMLASEGGGGVGRAGALRLVEALLARAAAAGGGGDGGAAAGADGALRRSSGGGLMGAAGGVTLQELARCIELLVRYVRLSVQEAAEALHAAATLQQQPAHGQQQEGSARVPALAHAARGRSGDAGRPRRGARARRAAKRVGDALSAPPARAAAAGLLAVASLAPGAGLALRAARLAPLLVLLNAGPRRQQQRQQQQDDPRELV